MAEEAEVVVQSGAAENDGKALKVSCHCLECGKSFKSISKLNRHKVIHSSERPHTCDVCGKSFIRSEHLRRHALSHRRTDEHACPEEACGRTFLLRSHLLRHIKTHTKPFLCDSCGAAFGKACQLRKHEQSHIKTPDGRPFSCTFDDTCRTTFRSYEGLKKHLRLHSEGKKHRCPECALIFVKFSQLVAHKRQQHLKSHLCDTCGKEFARASKLKLHVEVVHNDGEGSFRAFVCREPGCLQGFTTRSNLQTHYRAVHLGLRPFTCSYCGKSFAMRHILSRHRARLHLGEAKDGSVQRPSISENESTLQQEIAKEGFVDVIMAQVVASHNENCPMEQRNFFHRRTRQSARSCQ